MTIDPYDREAVINLLRRAGDHIAQGVRSNAIHTEISNLADHLEQED
ncbi:hypothetical protein ACTXJG_12050 [Glutamicibacter arilaitensis]